MEYNDMYLKKYQLEKFMNHKDVIIIIIEFIIKSFKR
jgi:hypothetical protein